MEGLRERKKRQTRAALIRAAVALFVERGFDDVSVAEIAAAAQVSKMTVFNYFRSKEDIVMAPVEEHAEESARAVRERRPGQSAVDALEENFLRGLAEREPPTGLSDAPSVIAIQRLIRETPALLQRLAGFSARNTGALASALAEATGAAPDDVLAHTAAAQLNAVAHELATRNVSRLVAGLSADEAYPVAVAEARAAYGVLRDGLGDYAR
ncbi:TetR/AcrR family transcriptional regulator [Catenuloplanes atrovinosus]|uniref:AcrR family transcriptional regulator n=1 Tax=Catenuloplanes atrovinosus TaxID=137266 RepID=A0AAE3YRA0_9ACTN|nr:helix-turn-helix domain-containing protein [Catenuloplanes atrovinosus]MDR7278404.1 AcrR family transcriptional regulator [Catenuloplanes atrovinosus]